MYKMTTVRDLMDKLLPGEKHRLHDLPERGFGVVAWPIQKGYEGGCICVAFAIIQRANHGGEPLWGSDFFDDPLAAVPDARGDIKWDGCANWESNPQCMIHFCDPSDGADFGAALTAAYQLAHELLTRPDFDAPTTESASDS